MKIAIVNVVGVEGSTGLIATKLAEGYRCRGHECRIYHGRGEKQKDVMYRKYGSYPDNVIHYLMAGLTGREGGYSSFYTKRIVKDITTFAPDLIILLNLHGHYLNIPMFMSGLAKTSAKIVYFMCDDYPYTARCEYAREGCEQFTFKCNGCPAKYKNLERQYDDKRRYYELLGDRLGFASVGYIVERARRSSLLKSKKLFTINTGIDTDFYKPVDTAALREKLGISPNKVILLNVAPFSNRRKGVEYFLEAAKHLEKSSKYVFINVGYDGDTSIKCPHNFLGIPFIKDQDLLCRYYSMADAYICTSLADALPNACVSAMSCGTPVVGFPVSGIPYLAEEPILHLVENVGVTDLVKYISSLEKKNEELRKKCRDYAIRNYSFPDFANKIYQSMKEL